MLSKLLPCYEITHKRALCCCFTHQRHPDIDLQLGTLRQLQRLYDELVEKADACRLDRYAASDKAGRWTLPFVVNRYESVVQCNCIQVSFHFFISIIFQVSVSNLSLFCLFQESVVVVTFHTTVFICSCERTLSLWRSWYWENYVDGHVFWSVVRIRLTTIWNDNLFLHFDCCWVCKHIKLLPFNSSLDFQALQLEEEKNSFSWLYAECPQPLASINLTPAVF